MGSARWWLVSVLVCAMAAPVRPAAIERTRLPLFELLGADGNGVTTDRLIRAGRWMVIYVQPDCRACENLLRIVMTAEHPRIPSRLAIILGGSTLDEVRATAARFPELSEAAWFADPSKASVPPLQIRATPAIFGLNGDMIEWSLGGVSGPSSEVKSVIASWIDGGR
jgi:hypothetical protein